MHICNWVTEYTNININIDDENEMLIPSKCLLSTWMYLNLMPKPVGLI